MPTKKPAKCRQRDGKGRGKPLPATDLLDDLFTGCALAAFLDQAEAEQGWPDAEATRRLAYRYYEDALAGKNAKKS